ncbi:hypothetical protein F5I97DRAFT_1412474 [Phlebopus sp. FC_14]|nr:hypothetical protein F5I97DRAFT_1412474 [Phlebopus sp. FC_14]
MKLKPPLFRHLLVVILYEFARDGVSWCSWVTVKSLVLRMGSAKCSSSLNNICIVLCQGALWHNHWCNQYSLHIGSRHAFRRKNPVCGLRNFFRDCPEWHQGIDHLFRNSLPLSTHCAD